MAYSQLSFTQPVQEAWQGISDKENEAQTAAIFGVVEANGGEVKVSSFSPSHVAIVSVIDYPDEKSAQKAVAEVQALGTLEFVSMHHLWDLAEYTAVARKAAQAS